MTVLAYLGLYLLCGVSTAVVLLIRHRKTLTKNDQELGEHIFLILTFWPMFFFLGLTRVVGAVANKLLQPKRQD